LLVKTIVDLIAELGHRYNGDPRIGFIEVGLLGHWGEFHSWPTTELFASAETQNKVLDAYEAAFKTTGLLVSRDIVAHTPMARIKDRRIGLHDDVFTREKLDKEPEHFYARLISHGMTDIWKRIPIGGEITLGQQSCIWDVPSCMPDDYYQAVHSLHATFLLNHRAFTTIEILKKRKEPLRVPKHWDMNSRLQNIGHWGRRGISLWNCKFETTEWLRFTTIGLLRLRFLKKEVLLKLPLTWAGILKQLCREKNHKISPPNFRSAVWHRASIVWR
jgi:hypothetical protein